MKDVHNCYYRRTGKGFCYHWRVSGQGFPVNESKASLWFCSTCQSYTEVEAAPQKINVTMTRMPKAFDSTKPLTQVGLMGGSAGEADDEAEPD